MTRTKTFQYKGEWYTRKELAELAGCTYNTMLHRLGRMGWTVEYAVEFKAADHKAIRIEAAKKRTALYEYKGQWHSLRALANLAGTKKVTLYHRIVSQGMSVAEAVETKTVKRKRGKQPQKRHKNAKLHVFEGKEYTIGELADRFNLGETTILQRMRKLGWSLEKALKRPAKKGPKFWYQDDLKTITELAELAGCPYEVMRNRLARNGNGDRAVAMGPARAKKPPKKLTQGEDTSG